MVGDFCASLDKAHAAFILLFGEFFKAGDAKYFRSCRCRIWVVLLMLLNRPSLKVRYLQYASKAGFVYTAEPLQIL
jgi:hypothetical protein